MEDADITIIGAGVVGLAIASELSKKHTNIIVLEKNDSFGRETSSRNSEVIHAGIYYPEGSLKARLCVEGARLLYEICEKHSIPHKKIGKLIVATDPSETGALDELLKKGTANGAESLTLLGKEEVKKMEPALNAVSALYSPGTGIVDTHSLMRHFLTEAESRGAIFSFISDVESVNRDKDGFVVGIRQENYKFRSRMVINSAGLSSDYVASLAGVDVVKSGYKLKYCKGSYFSYAKPSPVGMLVYPVPYRELEGLGVHATLDLGGRLRFGPDVEYIDSIDYKINPDKRGMFYLGASKIILGLDKEAFIPDMVGVRPKLSGPGEKTRDFIITDETGKGLPGLINLIGIESPGLTASPAIAKLVAGMVAGTEG